MYSHTHIYLKRFLFFFSFFIKGKENEGDSMIKVWMIKKTFSLVGVPPQIRSKAQVDSMYTI